MSCFYQTPLRIVSTQFSRISPGGRELMRFRGYREPVDSFGGESVVGSTMKFSFAPTAPDRRCGMSKVVMPDGRACYLQEVIDMAPEKVLGKAHFQKFGNALQLLVKFLDAEGQLALQAHPTSQRAREAFGQENGKTECWYILDVRDDASEPPYVLAGFKEGISREKFEALYEKQDIAAMEACCHKIPVKPDEMYLIDSGLVHAVGVGCFIIEIQEPSDLIVKTLKNPDYPQGEAAWKELQMGTYLYDGVSYEENLTRVLVPRKVRNENENGREEIVIGSKQTSRFGGLRYLVTGMFKPYINDFCSINIVVEGSGVLRYKGGEMPVKKADEIFLPAGIEELTFISDSATEPLTIMRAVPPYVI